MSTEAGPGIDKLLPSETWTELEKDAASVLIDVRTKPEWDFVGTPDLSSLGRKVLCIEWSRYPDMSENPRFVEHVIDTVEATGAASLYFICRSGVRSERAARAVSSALHRQGKSVRCVNVTEGFEGDLDPQKRRGGLCGWKARGLPWTQS